MRAFIDTRVAETRVAVIDEKERFVGAMVWRQRALSSGLRQGDISAGIVRSISENKQSAFVEVQTGEQIFLERVPTKISLAIGQHVDVLIKVGATSEKHAIGALSRHEPELSSAQAAISAFLEQFELTQEEAFEEPNQSFWQAAFDDILATSLSVPNGGRLHWDQPHLGTTVDVDSAGRDHKKMGTLNQDAVNEICRHISLRASGGLVIVDLVGAPNTEVAKSLVGQAKSALKRYGVSGVDVPPLSRLGLLQMAIKRTRPPAEPVLRDESLEGCLSNAINACEDELRSSRTCFLVVSMSPDIFGLANQTDFDWTGQLAQKYGQRFRVNVSRELPDKTHMVRLEQ